MVFEALLVVNFRMHNTKHGHLDSHGMGLAHNGCVRGGGASAQNRFSKPLYFLLLGMRRKKGT